MSRVLIVDSNETDRGRLSRELAALGHESAEEPDGMEAFERVMCEPVDLIVTEVELPRLNGIDLIVKLRAHGLKTPVLVVTGVTAAASIAALLKLDIAGYLHKSCSSEALRQKVTEALPPPAGGAAERSIAAARGPEPAVRATATASVLIFDAMTSVHERLAALFPASVRADCCSTVERALALAHGGGYAMILFDADASVLNLTGVIAQLHRLQPVAVLVAMATVGQSDDPRAVAGTLEPFGFDDIAWRPIQPAAIALLVEEYCSAWCDLVTVEEDVIRVSRLRRRGRDHDHYLNELSTRVAAALQAIGEACFEHAVLDLSRLDHLVPTELFALLKGLARAAAAIGITLLTVVNEALAADLHGLKESFSDGAVGGPASVFRFFTSVATARAAIG